jgi:hypothetical protein
MFTTRHALPRLVPGIAAALATAALGAGCVHRPSAAPRVTTITIDSLSIPSLPPELAPRYTTFWNAIADLELARLDKLAMTPDERRFRDAFALVMAGMPDSAEALFGVLYRNATDSLIRYRSRIALSSVLYAQEKWDELATLPRDARVFDTGLGRDRATIESWADYYRLLPPELVTFDSATSMVTLAHTPLGTPLIPVVVNGATRLFWLDTGSSFTMVSSDVAAATGIVPLSEDTLEVVTATGRVDAHPARVDSLRVGGVRFRHHPAMIVDANALRLTMPAAPGQTQVVPIDGILGFDAIRRMDVEIDYGRDVVTLRRPSHRAGPAERNLFWIGYPVVRLRSSTGRAVHFGLDTGADETFATRTLLPKVSAPRLIRDERRLEGLGGATTIRVQMIPEMRLTLGTHAVRFRNLIVVPPRRTTFVNLDGVLGTNAWTGARIRIDMENGRLEISPSR